MVDPDELARSFRGIATIGAPALIATMGDPTRFANAAAFRSFTGLTPRSSETGNTDHKGQPMSKAGSSLCRRRSSAPRTPPGNKTLSSPRSP